MNDIERKDLRRRMFEGNPLSNPSKQTLDDLFPKARLERIKRKAVRRYKLRQNSMWENFLRSVSE